MLTEELQKAFDEIVRTQLPQQVGEALKQELAELAMLREMMKSKAAEISKLEETVCRQRSANEALTEQNRTFREREAVLAQGEQKLAEGQAQLEMTLLKKDLQLANTRVEDHRNMLMAAFKNPTFREHVTMTHSSGSYQGNGVTQSSTTVSGTENKTVTRDVE